MVLLSYHRIRLQIGAFIFSMSATGFLIRISAEAFVDIPYDNDPMEGLAANLIWPLGMVLALAAVWRMIALGKGDAAALRVLPEGLEVSGFWRRRVVPWDSLLGGHQVNYATFFHRNRFFNVRYLENGANRTARVPLILTKRPSGGQMSLPAKIDKAREEAMARPYRPTGERIEGTGIDHDGAIARYLAQKAQAEAQPKAQAGSKAAVPAAAPLQPAGLRPARPAFGRKGLS